MIKSVTAPRHLNTRGCVYKTLLFHISDFPTNPRMTNTIPLLLRVCDFIYRPARLLHHRSFPQRPTALATLSWRGSQQKEPALNNNKGVSDSSVLLMKFTGGVRVAGSSGNRLSPWWGSRRQPKLGQLNTDKWQEWRGGLAHFVFQFHWASPPRRRLATHTGRGIWEVVGGRFWNGSLLHQLHFLQIFLWPFLDFSPTLLPYIIPFVLHCVELPFCLSQTGKLHIAVKEKTVSLQGQQHKNKADLNSEQFVKANLC